MAISIVLSIVCAGLIILFKGSSEPLLDFIMVFAATLVILLILTGYK